MDQSERIRALRAKTGMSRTEFCEHLEIPYRTVSEWENGGRRPPEYVIRLLEYYVRLQALGKETHMKDEVYPDVVREPEYVYGSDAKKDHQTVRKDGEYTIEDYFALPDDRRAELIDGVFYDMATPHTIHQGLTGALYSRLLTFVGKKKGKCMPMISPVSVQLDRDDKTMVEPDVIIVCDRDKFRKGVVYGAPDFVAEVLSPSTRKKDLTLKLHKYADAGVREYWIIDPRDRKVVVYHFETDDAPVIYGLDAKVPVAVWDGECSVDFGAIMDDIGFLEQQ